MPSCTDHAKQLISGLCELSLTPFRLFLSAQLVNSLSHQVQRLSRELVYVFGVVEVDEAVM